MSGPRGLYLVTKQQYPSLDFFLLLRASSLEILPTSLNLSKTCSFSCPHYIYIFIYIYISRSLHAHCLQFERCGMVLMSHIREASKVTVNSSYFHPVH